MLEAQYNIHTYIHTCAGMSHTLGGIMWGSRQQVMWGCVGRYIVAVLLYAAGWEVWRATCAAEATRAQQVVQLAQNRFI
jgi:hypothetical protein